MGHSLDISLDALNSMIKAYRDACPEDPDAKHMLHHFIVGAVALCKRPETTAEKFGLECKEIFAAVPDDLFGLKVTPPKSEIH